eukprot:COSAG01_NODE_1101_length_11689_cov_159.757722_3_plen_176_part_00
MDPINGTTAAYDTDSPTPMARRARSSSIMRTPRTPRGSGGDGVEEQDPRRRSIVWKDEATQGSELANVMNFQRDPRHSSRPLVMLRAPYPPRKHRAICVVSEGLPDVASFACVGLRLPVAGWLPTAAEQALVRAAKRAGRPEEVGLRSALPFYSGGHMCGDCVSADTLGIKLAGA